MAIGLKNKSMQLPPGEIKKIKKLLLQNLIAGSSILLTGILTYYFGGHKLQAVAFLLMVLGIVWVTMSLSKMLTVGQPLNKLLVGPKAAQLVTNTVTS